MKTAKRFIPLLVILALMVGVRLAGLTDYLSFDNLKQHRETLDALVGRYAVIAPLSYIFLYAVLTAISFPGGALLSIFCGFLFGQPYATIYVVTGATIGASAVFLAARTALGESLRKKAGPKLQKMEAGFNENAASYLLFLRLIPLFPFWLVNVAPAFFGVRLRTYIWTTFFGIIPGAFVYTQAGVGLGSILDRAERFSVDAIFNTDIKIALAALAIFALIPVIYKKVRKQPNKDVQ